MKIRLIQGSQEEQHSFTMHGHKWLREGADPHSGYFNAQAIGISEHFEFNLTNGLPPIGGAYGTADFMYQSAVSGDLWNGMWGLMRTYKKRQTNLKTLGHLALQAADFVTLDPAALSYKEKLRAWEPLPLLEMPEESVLVKLDPLKEETLQPSFEVDEKGEPARAAHAGVRHDVPRADAPARPDIWSRRRRSWGGSASSPRTWTRARAAAWCAYYRVSAIDAANWLPGGRLVYNDTHDIYDPDAILFVKDEHLADIKSGARKPEPLILRARAGECVQVVLTNRLPLKLSKTPQWAHHSAITPYFNVNQVTPSNHVSLHPQLVHYDVNTDDGANVGLNAPQTVSPGGRRVYRWYTGDFRSSVWSSPLRRGIATPVEFGIVNLRNMADVVNHGMHGGIGALIIEPPDAIWSTDPGTEAQARVQYTDVAKQTQTFRELVLLLQDDLGLHSDNSRFWDTDGLNSGTALRNIKGVDDSQDTGLKGFNYRTEPLWARLGVPPQTAPEDINDMELGDILSSTMYGEPATPLFTAKAGEALRVRVGQPSGHGRQHAFALHGAEWYANPWAAGTNSQRMGPNPGSFVIATQGGMSVMQSWNFVPEYGAGGLARAPGDYLYRDLTSFQWSGGGLWGVLRVE